MEKITQDAGAAKKSISDCLKFKITMGREILDNLNVAAMKSLVDSIRKKIDDLIAVFDVDLEYPVPEPEAIFAYHDAKISIIYALIRLLMAFEGALDEYRSSSEVAPGINLLMYEKYELEGCCDKENSLPDNIYQVMTNRFKIYADNHIRINDKFITSMFPLVEKRKIAIKIAEYYDQVLLQQKEVGKVWSDEYERLMKQAVPIQKLQELLGIVIEEGNEFAVASSYEKLIIYRLNI